MKGYNGWSYAPYKPFLFETGDIYICRIAPGVDNIHFEWLGEAEAEYKVYLRERESSQFICCGATKGNEYTIGNLIENRDYEFYVTTDEKKSRIRLARTGNSVGTVVNYLHPDDKAYSFSGNYLASPSLVKYPDGCLLASMDIFEGNAPQNLTLIYRSDDNGETWHYVSELMPCFWGKLFLHKGDLYMLAVSTEYGDLVIGKSTDKGSTFTTPTVLLRGSGSNKISGIHKNPQNVVYYKGRLYETLEWGTWNTSYKHAAMVMSCDENDDLLKAENWHFTSPVLYDSKWSGTAEGFVQGNLEGTLCVNPEGKLMNVMRYMTTMDSEPTYGLVIQYCVNTEDPDAPLEYSHTTRFPANRSKFMWKYDEVSKRYYSIASRIISDTGIANRNLLSLMGSYDMESWEVITDILDYKDVDPKRIGFQYVDFSFDGEDIIFLCRTAMNNAHNYHDTNYSTFHRIRNFRGL